MDTYKCIQEYPIGNVSFKKGDSYRFEKIEYCSHRFREIEYRLGPFFGGNKVSIPEEKFKKHFINLKKRRDFILVKLLEL